MRETLRIFGIKATNRISRNLQLVVLGVIFGFSPMAGAVEVTSLSHVQIGTQFYDVTFSKDSFDTIFGPGMSSSTPEFFGDSAGAQVATLAIMVALGSADHTGLWNHDGIPSTPRVESDLFWVPYETFPATNNQGEDVVRFRGWRDNNYQLGVDTGIEKKVRNVTAGNKQIPIATFSAVPLPAAAWLMASAVIGFGMMGRRGKRA